MRSDAALFDFYSSLIAGGSRFGTPLREAVAAAKSAFAYDGSCPANLVVSHRKRLIINAKLNKQLAPADAVRLDIAGRACRGNSGQTMLIWPGIQLLGSVPTEKKGIRNGCLYTVKSIDKEAEVLQLLENLEKLTFEQVKAWLRLSFAQTYASVQGTEFDTELRLHDTGHAHFSMRHLFVGLSRAKSAAKVSVVD